MCNAWNHPLGCTCGWGGEGHHGGGGSSANNVVYPSVDSFKIVNQNKIRYSTFDSFVNPNAMCPVCGELVFYYESPYGGKVYFDSLGPPWPKHTCTDNDSSNVNPRKYKYIEWKAYCWEPFTLIKFKEYDSEYFIFECLIIKESMRVNIYVKKYDLLGIRLSFLDNPFHLKRLENKLVLISTFNDDLAGAINELIFRGNLAAPGIILRKSKK